MNRKPKLAGLMLFILGLATVTVQAQSGVNFDRLTDEDRQAFQKRFEKELWPLLTRHKRDGCVGCHSGNIVSALRMTGDVNKDFPMLVKQGFFIPNDAGSLLSRMLDKDPKRIMPPPAKDPNFKRPHWTAEELNVLRTFVIDLDRKQKR